jgi:CRP-like cAMP-binding protein
VLPPGEDESLSALTDARLVLISTTDRDRLLESPLTARLLVDGLAETLRQKHAAVASMSRLHHVDRVREKLLELARDHGRVGRDGVRLDFPLTHDLLGEMTGSARETVTRALDELQREGFVERRGRTYTLRVSPDALSVTSVTVRA